MNAEALLESLLRGGLSRATPDRLSRLAAGTPQGGGSDSLSRAAADAFQRWLDRQQAAEPQPNLRMGAVPPSAPPVGGGRHENPVHAVGTGTAPPAAMGAGAPLAPPESPKLPGAADALPPPLPDAGPGAAPQFAHGMAQPSEGQALLLIRAMIAAAKADGAIGPKERRRILSQLEADGAGAAERDYVEAEMVRPLDPDDLLRGSPVPDTRTALAIYAASLLASDADTPAQRAYLHTLARRLGLDAPAIEDLHRRAGLPPPDRRT